MQGALAAIREAKQLDTLPLPLPLPLLLSPTPTPKRHPTQEAKVLEAQLDAFSIGTAHGLGLG